MCFPCGEAGVYKCAAGPAVGERRAFSDDVVAVVAHERIAVQRGQPAKFIGISYLDHRAGKAGRLAHDVIVDARVHAGRAAGIWLPILEGHPKVDSAVVWSIRHIDQGIVIYLGVLCCIQAYAGKARVYHQIIAHDASDVFIVPRIRPGVEELGACVETHKYPGFLCPFDAVVLNKRIGRAALGIDTGGAYVVDVVVVRVHAAAVYVVYALRIARAPAICGS